MKIYNVFSVPSTLLNFFLLSSISYTPPNRSYISRLVFLRLLLLFLFYLRSTWCRSIVSFWYGSYCCCWRCHYYHYYYYFQDSAIVVFHALKSTVFVLLEFPQSDVKTSVFAFFFGAMQSYQKNKRRVNWTPTFIIIVLQRNRKINNIECYQNEERNHTNMASTDGQILSEEKNDSPRLTLQPESGSRTTPTATNNKKSNDNDTKPFIVWQAIEHIKYENTDVNTNDDIQALACAAWCYVWPIV